MTVNSRQALVGDIGGTHARFAIADIDELSIAHFVVFRCEMFGSLEEAIRAYRASIPHRPRMAGLAVAGPTAGENLRLTNRPWTFTRADLKKACGVEQIHILNDFEALALALPHLTAHDLEDIGGGAQAGGVKTVLGPGTGLGVAALVPSPAGWTAIATEGGHVTFPAESAEDLEIADAFRASGHAHISAEDLVSGPGLARLYRILAARSGAPVETLPVPDIVRRGLGGEDPVARAALERFVGWLGRFAGDMALAHGATGGLYLGGGIAPRLVDLLSTPLFRDAFLEKGRLRPYLESLPVRVIKAHDAGLKGAAVALSASLAPA